MSEHTVLQVENLQKRYKKNTVLDGVSFEVGDDEFAVLYGLPGSGKSVILRTIMGLEPPDGGTIVIRGNDAATMLPGERNIGYVPQSFALFPDKSVRDNIGYPLTFTDTPRDEIAEAVDSVAKMLQIQDHLEKLPSQLSGGQKQRVAIARGLVKKTG
ncbi:MAG: ABC transporter ATP-binding protein, partial [Spirochaeta sp.]|nr:ABC transporter ATP-binding protein [Spirochaeta sp.]